MTVTRAKVEVSIPRKRRGDCSQHEKGLNKFYDQCIQAIIRHVNFDVVKAVIIASPGFVRQKFFDYMYQQVCKTFNMLIVQWPNLLKTLYVSLMVSCFQAVKTDNKLLFEHKSKFLLVHSSSGFKHSLKEVKLYNPARNHFHILLQGFARSCSSSKIGRHKS